MELHFCSQCGISIPQSEIESGGADAGGGKFLCSEHRSGAKAPAGDSDPASTESDRPGIELLFCSNCRVSIPIRYPLVEAVNGGLWLALALTRGPSLQTLASMVLVTALLVLSLIDLDHMLLPNVITLPGILLGIVASALPGSPISPLEAAAAAAAGYLGFAAIWWAWKVLRGLDALGQGDWKLAAMLGAWLGWQQMLLTVFIACLIGALVGVVLLRRQAQDKLPLGTFLGASGIVVVFFGDRLLSWYGGLFGG